jgi:hypothetical protein
MDHRHLTIGKNIASSAMSAGGFFMQEELKYYRKIDDTGLFLHAQLKNYVSPAPDRFYSFSN